MSEELNTTDEVKDEKSIAEQKFDAAIKKINDNAREEDTTPTSRITFREILGGNMLSAHWIRSQIWLMLLIVVFTRSEERRGGKECGS